MKDQTVEWELNPKLEKAMHLMEETDQNVFITGKAGTGKSTLLETFCKTSSKNPVILAPTGVAALNVKGQTIHRFFHFYIDITPTKVFELKLRSNQKKIYKNLKTLVIDEISMVRADLFDCIATFLSLYGPHPGQPFGGVQMILVGDLFQLPPVVNFEDKVIFSSVYETPYFFSAHSYQGLEVESIELEKVYRQKDNEFLDLLNKVRNNSIEAQDLVHLNSRYQPQAVVNSNEFCIHLTTTNAKADAINDGHMKALEGECFRANAVVCGDFGKEYYPTALHITYKINSQIMMLNNDTKKRWVNGTIGLIEAVKKDEKGQEFLMIRLQEDNRIVTVTPFTWEVFRFTLEGEDIVSEPVGTFTQYPFRLAWAVTIHKSQGKTFEKVYIDLSGAFAAGQAYVALSRCTTLEGIILKAPIKRSAIRTDPRIQESY